MSKKTINYDMLKEQSFQNPEVKALYDALEPAYQVTCLRIQQGMTQEELANKVGTKQPNIARLESGESESSIDLLRRVAKALGGKLLIRIEMPQDRGSGTPCP
jgi:ribosome-binding protein aMBF1 (putative translation factor)